LLELERGKEKKEEKSIVLAKEQELFQEHKKGIVQN